MSVGAGVSVLPLRRKSIFECVCWRVCRSYQGSPAAALREPDKTDKPDHLLGVRECTFFSMSRFPT